MTQAHGAPSFGPTFAAGDEFGATTVSTGRPRQLPGEDPAPTMAGPTATGTPRPEQGAPAPGQFPHQAGPTFPNSGPASGPRDGDRGAPGSGPTPGSSPGQGGPHGGPGVSRTGANRARPRGPRRARLQLRHVNPWTVLKFSCVLSIALFFVWLIVVGVLFGVLDAAGVIGKINDTVTTINGAGSKEPVTAGIVFGGAAIIGVINIVLFIALTTIGSVIYNLCADLVGGIELTLSES